jgi:hypothetical protein
MEKQKTIRFGDLVKNSGRPEIVTLWGDPEKQKGFAKAIKENRVLTVIQNVGGQKDYGLIKFDREAHAVYLVFPRPLPKGPDARVIGINYQLTDEPPVTDPVDLSTIVPPKPKPKHAPPPEPDPEPEPEPKPEPPKKEEPRSFTITIRRTAVIEKEFTVKALTDEAAEEEALKAARKAPFKVKEAKMSDEIVK